MIVQLGLGSPCPPRTWTSVCSGFEAETCGEPPSRLLSLSHPLSPNQGGVMLIAYPELCPSLQARGRGVGGEGEGTCGLLERPGENG